MRTFMIFTNSIKINQAKINASLIRYMVLLWEAVVVRDLGLRVSWQGPDCQIRLRGIARKKNKTQQQKLELP